MHSCGKLLLTGEYLILLGARGLALPTSRGQSLEVKQNSENEGLRWRSYDSEGRVWFEGVLDTEQMEWIEQSDEITAARLKDLLDICSELNPDFSINGRMEVNCRLEFPNNWGLGSSSTLINNMADWSEVDAFDLLENSFKGSGYDVAVAMEKKPILFERHQGEPFHEEIEFSPAFKDQLWFIHLGKKRDTASAVEDFQQQKERAYPHIGAISKISESLVPCQDIAQFEDLLKEHNRILSEILQTKSSEAVYSDYTGGVTKYLGAWGGDFMLATGRAADMDYFRSKGLETILSYNEMIA